MSEWEEFAAYRNMIRKAKAEAWEEGYTQGNNDIYNGDFPTHNPYRQGEGSGNSNSQPTAETSNLLNKQDAK